MMPDRTPAPTRPTPTRLDHVFAHPAELVAACWWVAYGTLLVLPTLLAGWTPSPTLSVLDPWVPVTAGLLMVPGGALTLWGLRLSSYTPTVGDRVLLLQVARTWVVLGKLA